MPDDADRAYRWLFAVSLAAGCAALLLIAAYYWRHPDRHVVSDFEPRVAPPRFGARPHPGGVADDGAAPSGQNGSAAPGHQAVEEAGGMT